MEIIVYNQEGKEMEKILLPKEIFDVKINHDLIHQVVVSQMANQRKVLAQTKTRGEVSGGGKKPWRQKGTGRARHGSIRSPLWRGGGITFGPRKEKVFKKTIPKKIKRKALLMILTAKAKSNLLILLDKLKLEKAKTKSMAGIIDNLKLKAEFRDSSKKINLLLSPSLRLGSGTKQKKKTKSSPSIENFKKENILIALPEMNKNIILAARNLPRVKTIQVKDLNCLDLLSFKYLIMPKESIKMLSSARERNEAKEEDEVVFAQ